MLLKFEQFCTFLASYQGGTKKFHIQRILKNFHGKKKSEEKATRHSEGALGRVQVELLGVIQNKGFTIGIRPHITVRAGEKNL